MQNCIFSKKVLKKGPALRTHRQLDASRLGAWLSFVVLGVRQQKLKFCCPWGRGGRALRARSAPPSQPPPNPPPTPPHPPPLCAFGALGQNQKQKHKNT